ncbi:hypothetical protein JCM9279_007583 [Rhodotorula babjevae]
MLVARTPPPTSPVHHDLVSHDFFRPHTPSSARPSVARRPSALRNASSDHLITPAVTRFATGQPASIPPSQPVSTGSEPLVPSGSVSSPCGIVRPSPVRAASSSSSRGAGAKPTGPASPGSLALPSPGLAAGAAVATSPFLVRPSLNPLGGSSDSSAPSSNGSLLARRRSSRSTARPDVLPLLADLSLAGALPSPSLAELDDDVRPTVIGESSHAQTPASEASSPVVARAPGGVKQVVETEFRPTRELVSTPFPSKMPDWIDEEDELDSPACTSTAQRDAIVGSRKEAAEQDDAQAP